MATKLFTINDTELAEKAMEKLNEHGVRAARSGPNVYVEEDSMGEALALAGTEDFTELLGKVTSED